MALPGRVPGGRVGDRLDVRAEGVSFRHAVELLRDGMPAVSPAGRAPEAVHGAEAGVAGGPDRGLNVGVPALTPNDFCQSEFGECRIVGDPGALVPRAAARTRGGLGRGNGPPTVRSALDFAQVPDRILRMAESMRLHHAGQLASIRPCD